MSIPLTDLDVKVIMDQIDENIEGMTGILQEELRKLNNSFEVYLKRINKIEIDPELPLHGRLENARMIFERVKLDAHAIAELQEPLNHIKEVNKMVRFAMQNMEGQTLVKISSCIGAIANICLGQLKFIKTRYESILKLIRQDITQLWMDRELSGALRLILSVNHRQFNKFLASFHHAEALYADISLAINREVEELQQRVVLRMVSNRLPSIEERKIINTLFPSWDAAIN